MKQRVREFLKATPFQPFVIRTVGGKEYRVSQPGLVIAASDRPNIYFEDPDTGSLHIIHGLQVTDVNALASA